MLGVDEMTVVNWEKGRTKPLKKYIKRVRDFIQDASLESYALLEPSPHELTAGFSNRGQIDKLGKRGVKPNKKD